MPRTQGSPAPRDRFASDLGRAWLFARWLLVLAMVFDQVSAPFHRHHHDGVDFQLGMAVAHTYGGDSESLVGSGERLVGSHFALAIRVKPSRLGQLPAVDPSDSVMSVSSRLQWPAAPELPARVLRFCDRPTPNFRSHRSLPPSSRAPPLHA